MSKSNNNLYTPEYIGEKEGEHSPFFHTPSTEELKKILLKSQSDLSFLDEDSILEFSTFFHEETRKQFLEDAQKHAAERTEIAERIADLTTDLATAVFHLASIMSPPKEKKKDLLASCASRALFASEFMSEVSTNILLPIHRKSISEVENNIFFQIQKNLFFVEQVEKHLEILPKNADARRHLLLIYPPSVITDHIASVSDNYKRAKQFSGQALIDSTKAAKQENLAKHNNILHNATMHLHDLARVFETSAKELKSKARTV